MNPAEQQVQSFLRGDLPRIVLATVICFTGLAAVALRLLRRGSKDYSLLPFGFLCLLYGVRLLAGSRAIWLLFAVPPQTWPYLGTSISQVILIPALLFFEAVYGKGWKSSVRWLVWIQVAYATAAISVDIAWNQPGLAPDPALLISVPLLALVLVLGRLFSYRHPAIAGSRALQAGSAVFMVFVLQEHLVNAGLLPWRLRLEPIGFLVFIGSLGYVAALRFFSNEQQLIAIEKEMEAATRIQVSILPREMPQVAGLDVAAGYVPLSSVAGDFYDFLPVDGERLGILVADVAGHGVPAALIASMVKVALLSQASSAGDPARLLAALNDSFCRQAHGQLLTAGYLFLDVPNRKALYAGAGHPPLLLWQGATATLRELQQNGLLMGFRPGARYTSVEFELQGRDRILLYTDGITEASNAAGECFGERRLPQFIQEQQQLPAGEFVDRLLHEVAQWSGQGTGEAREDDLTLVVIDVRPT